jgi:hypothetical protein
MQKLRHLLPRSYQELHSPAGDNDNINPIFCDVLVRTRPPGNSENQLLDVRLSPSSFLFLQALCVVLLDDPSFLLFVSVCRPTIPSNLFELKALYIQNDVSIMVALYSRSFAGVRFDGCSGQRRLLCRI